MADMEKIREYISQLLQKKDDSDSFTAQDRLISAGRLDSVDVLDIVVFLESNYGLDFSERGIDINDFDSLDSISRMMDEMKS